MSDDATLGDFVDLVRGRTYKGPLVGAPGPALLGLGSIVPGGGFRSDFKTYGGDCPPELMLVPGDLYVSLKGATKDGEMIGSVARVPVSVPSGRLTQDTVRLVFRERQPAAERYIYWLLRTPDYRAYCAARATGSAVVALSRADFLSYPVPPRTIVRDRLVEVLEFIEDKISSTRHLVALIPDLMRARVLSAMETASEAVPVSSLARFVNGGAFTKNASGTGRMVIRIAELNGGPGGSTVYSDIEVPDEKTARSGDILMSWSGSLDVYRWSREDAIINQHIFKVIPGRYPAWLVFDRLDAVIEVFQGIAKDKATTMGHIQRGHLESTLVELPPADEIRGLDAALGALWDRLLLAEREALRLAALRDALLPELLSGRIRVASDPDNLCRSTPELEYA